MTAERWLQVKEIFHAACDRAVAERPAFLDAACVGDAALRQEVESLLATDEQAGSFIRHPLLDVDTPATDEAAKQAELEAGQMVGHYRIERRLGAGGMGVVYLARDTQLGRLAALKLLQAHLTQDAARVRRFQQEARAASALNHPNILTIYEVGQTVLTTAEAHYIAAEFVDGMTLREQSRSGGFALGTALDVLIQVAGALAAAHEAGIIHRDIKPENLILRRDGLVKVLDFGLAKLIEQALRPPIVRFTHVTTQPGVVMGTVSYMSPEQARGLGVDGRSDLFSLGVVMYELLTGHTPFEGETTGDVLVALLSGEPCPLARHTAGLPAALQEIANCALAKPIEERYQTARALGDDLKRLKEELEFAARLKGKAGSKEDVLTLMVGASHKPTWQPAFATPPVIGPSKFATRQMAEPALAEQSNKMRLAAVRGRLQRHGKSLAWVALVSAIIATVLGWQWIAPGSGAIDSVAVLPFANVGNDPQTEYLPDGITESLINSLSPALRVMARSTVFTYKGREVDPRQVGASLKVRAVVTGRVQRQGERLVIRVELADAANGAQLWHAEYQRHFTDLLTVQEEIVREISLALRLRLSGAEKRQLGKRYTGDAEAYQLYLKGRYVHRQYTQASMEKALDYFQQAIARDSRYALAYAGMADVYADLSSQYLLPAEAMPKARQAALTALTLDGTLAEAHNSLALVKMWGDWDWAGAEREFQRAIELNPNFPVAHMYYGGGLSQQGRDEDAIREVRKAAELDPLSAQASNLVSRAFFYARQYDRVIEHCHKTFELTPNHAGAHVLMACAFSEKRMYAEALDEFRQAVALDPRPGNRAYLAYGYAITGQPGRARKIINELEQLATRERVSAVTLARPYLGLGENDRALAWLQKAYDEHSDHLLNLRDPLYDPLRADPRFAELVRGIGHAN